MNIRYDMLRVMTDRRFKALMILGVLLMSVGVVTAAISANAPGIAKDILCAIANIIWWIAVASIVLLIVMYGIKWATSADDPSARTAAKNGVIHVIVGAIILALAATIVLWLFGLTGATADMDIYKCIMQGSAT